MEIRGEEEVRDRSAQHVNPKRLKRTAGSIAAEEQTISPDAPWAKQEGIVAPGTFQPRVLPTGLHRSLLPRGHLRRGGRECVFAACVARAVCFLQLRRTVFPQRTSC